MKMKMKSGGEGGLESERDDIARRSGSTNVQLEGTTLWGETCEHAVRS